jgi:hypothetical protein
MSSTADPGITREAFVVTASGRDALGARITVTTGKRKQIDEVRSGGYHISQGDFRVHFGLGQATKADVGIRWPQGPSKTFKGCGRQSVDCGARGQGNRRAASV